VATKDPEGIAETGVEKGVAKARMSWDKAIVGGFLAGAYIAFGALLATTTTAGMNPEIWGTLPTFFAGAVFSLGLILVIIGGSELLTGNMALVPLAAFKRKVPLKKLFENFGVVLVGNLIGAVFVAYFLAEQTGVVTDEMPLARLTEIAMTKAVEETEWQIFLRAVGCNWLVCLAVMLALAAEDVAGKILAIFFPIMAFVAMGFDHVVANMFFLPAAIFAGVDITWWDAIHNWIFAFLGNLVGAAVFVAGAYWFLYAREDEPDEPQPGGVHGSRTADGRAGSPAAAREPAA
jgi:formate transporter